jgi:hypothetical protein
MIEILTTAQHLELENLSSESLLLYQQIKANKESLFEK